MTQIFGVRFDISLPDGYSGPFAVVYGHPQGSDIELKSSQIKLRIPQSGVLLVKGDVPFDRWHRFSVAYVPSGEIAKCESLYDTRGELIQDAFNVWEIDSGCSPESRPPSFRRIWLIYGTSRHEMALRRALDSADRCSTGDVIEAYKKNLQDTP